MAKAKATTVAELRDALPAVLARGPILLPPPFDSDGRAYDGSTRAEHDALQAIVDRCRNQRDLDTLVADVAAANRKKLHETDDLTLVEFAALLIRKPPKAAVAKRRRRTLPAERPLTPNETATLRAVADCGGNVAKAARQLGKHHSTVAEQKRNALAKIGRSSAEKFKVSLKALPTDNRGQVDVRPNDRRRRGK